MKNKTCQVRVSDETITFFTNIYENRKKKNPEYTKKALMDDIIKKAYINEFNLDEQNTDVYKALNDQQYLLNKIYEYVALLTKGCNTLPIDSNGMKDYVTKPSRFEKLIKEKLNLKKEDITTIE